MINIIFERKKVPFTILHSLLLPQQIGEAYMATMENTRNARMYMKEANPQPLTRDWYALRTF